MSFYREHIVKKPKKEYVCEYCGKPIAGEHVYMAGINSEGDFTTMRSHPECHEIMKEACSKCADRDDCYASPSECYSELQKNKQESSK